MTHFFRAGHRLAAVLVAAAAGLTIVQTGPAAAAGSSSIPTAEARAAGVEPGNARMGWRQHRAAEASSLRSQARAGAQLAAPRAAFVPTGVLGIDVSSWQGNVNWTTQAALGKRFAYVKATEGLTYKNPYFRS